MLSHLYKATIFRFWSVVLHPKGGLLTDVPVCHFCFTIHASRQNDLVYCFRSVHLPPLVFPSVCLYILTLLVTFGLQRYSVHICYASGVGKTPSDDINIDHLMILTPWSQMTLVGAWCITSTACLFRYP